MRAYRLHGVNDLRYENIEKPVPQKGWALVKVGAAGICSSDIPRIYVKGTYHFPTIPGHEFSGVVESVGDISDDTWLGKRVSVFPLIPCKKCNQCKLHKYEMCDDYDYIGSRRDGAFAEYVLVPVWNLLELPENIPFTSAAMMEPLAVGLHAVNCAGVKSSDTVAVVGTGMIGFAVAQWAIYKGAKEVAIVGRSNDKKKIADGIHGLKYLSCEEVDKKYSVVIEAVGSQKTIEQSIEMCDAGGKVVLMGNPEGNITISQNVYWRILRKQLQVSGTWNSAYESGMQSEWTEAIEAIRSGKIDVSALLTHVYSFEKLEEGLKLMKEHKETYCKVMVKFDE